MFMPEVWILWSKKKIVIIFQKENGNTFTLLIIFIVKSLQKEQNSKNLLLWPPICRNKPAITPKWFNSLDTNSSANALTCVNVTFNFEDNKTPNRLHCVSALISQLQTLLSACSARKLPRSVLSNWAWLVRKFQNKEKWKRKKIVKMSFVSRYLNSEIWQR